MIEVRDYKGNPKQKYCCICCSKLKRREVFMLEDKRRICKSCFLKKI